MEQAFFQKNRWKLAQHLEPYSVVVLFAGKAPLKRGDEYYPIFT